jgi:hypothetical protein
VLGALQLGVQAQLLGLELFDPAGEAADPAPAHEARDEADNGHPEHDQDAEEGGDDVHGHLRGSAGDRAARGEHHPRTLALPAEIGRATPRRRAAGRLTRGPERGAG